MVSTYRFLVALLFSLVVFAGCSSSSDSVFVAQPQPAPSVGTIQLSQVLLRAVPTEVTQQRFTGFDSQGAVRFGPVTEAKAATITLENVSTAVTRLQIEYLQGDTVIGLGSTAVIVVLGETTEINDPPFQDVTSALDSIQVSPGGTTIAHGSARQFTAIGTFADNAQVDLTSSVTWASSDPATATINSSGLAAAVDPGSTIVSANLGPISGNADLTVSTATIESIAVSPSAASIVHGTTQQFTATATLTDSSTQDVTNTANWISATPAVATINASTGLATAVEPGQSVVTATVGSVSGNATLTVAGASVLSLAVTPGAVTLADGTTQQFTAIATLSDMSQQNVTSSAQWLSATPATATVNDTGLATAVNPGSSVITATFGGESASGTLTVTAATIDSIAVTPNSPAIANTTNQQFTAIATLSDNRTQDVTNTAAWVSNTPATASIETTGQTNPGLATAEDPGQSLITATVGTVSGSTTLTVTSATIESIAISPPAALSALGTKRQYAAIATLSDATTQDVTSQVVWSANNGVTVANDNLGPNKDGRATIPGTATGPVTITASLGAQNANAVLNLGNFAYVTNSDDNTISAFTIDPANGNLTPTVPDHTFDTGSGPVNLAVDPTGRFAYVANLGSDRVSAFTIDPTTGALGNRTDSLVGDAPYELAVDPTGRFLYCANAGENFVSSFLIDPITGALSNRTDTFAGGDFSFSVAVDPTGRFVYILNANNFTVSNFEIDPITGVPDNRMSSPVAGGPISVTVDPTGRFVYVVNWGAENIYSFPIDPMTGALGNKTETNLFPAELRALTVHPTGRFAYIPDADDGNVSAFTIDPMTGVLGNKTDTYAGTKPSYVTVEPTGRFAYVIKSTVNTVSALTIDLVSGALDPASLRNFDTGRNPLSVTTTP